MTNEEAIKILDAYYKGYFGYKFDDVIVAHQKAIEALKNERKGEWISTDSGWRCSACGYEQTFSKSECDYCMKCGAEMRH